MSKIGHFRPDLMLEMRKDTLYAFGSLAIFAWVAMTYFLFVHRPHISLEEVRRTRIVALKDRTQDFEVKLNGSVEESSVLLARVKDLAESKHSPNKKVAKIEPVMKKKSQDSNLVTKFDEDLKVDVKEPVEVKDKVVEDLGAVIPVLMFACNRVTVNIAIDSLLKARKDSIKFPIIVSQVKGHFIFKFNHFKLSFCRNCLESN